LEETLAVKEPFRRHLEGSSDLVTTREAYRAGFIALALEKNDKATPYVEQARALRVAAARATAPAQLVDMEDIRPAMLTAAGVSDKAALHLQEGDRRQAILGLVRRFLEPAGQDFVDELVYRFLLTRGDTLGGSMRNIGGSLAQQKLTASIIRHLEKERCSYRWRSARTKEWSLF